MYLKFFICCKHLLLTMILHLTGSCPKKYHCLRIFGGRYFHSKMFAVFCNVSIPLWIIRWTRHYDWIALKKFIFVVVDKFDLFFINLFSFCCHFIYVRIRTYLLNNVGDEGRTCLTPWLGKVAVRHLQVIKLKYMKYLPISKYV